MNEFITKHQISQNRNAENDQIFAYNERFDRKLLQDFYGNNIDEAHLTFSMFLNTTAEEFLSVIERIAIEDFKVIKRKLHKMQPKKLFKVILMDCLQVIENQYFSYLCFP